VGDAAFLDAFNDRVEIGLVDQEGIMLGGDLPVGLHEVEIHAVGELDDHEGAERLGLGQSQHLGEKARGCLLVACVNDGVIKLGGHGALRGE
jgi:hypothetical protein